MQSLHCITGANQLTCVPHSGSSFALIVVCNLHYSDHYSDDDDGEDDTNDGEDDTQ